jgi:hypothetical protein
MSHVSMISVRDLINANRWDAGFHLSLKHLADRVAHFKSTIYPQTAIERLSQVAFQDKKCLMDLIPGNSRVMSKSSIDRICLAYPFLALALVEDMSDEIIERLREQMTIDQGHLDAVLEISSHRDTTIKAKINTDGPGMKLI